MNGHKKMIWKQIVPNNDISILSLNYCMIKSIMETNISIQERFFIFAGCLSFLIQTTLVLLRPIRRSLL